MLFYFSFYLEGKLGSATPFNKKNKPTPKTIMLRIIPIIFNFFDNLETSVFCFELWINPIIPKTKPSKGVNNAITMLTIPKI